MKDSSTSLSNHWGPRESNFRSPKWVSLVSKLAQHSPMISWASVLLAILLAVVAMLSLLVFVQYCRFLRLKASFPGGDEAQFLLGHVGLLDRLGKQNKEVEWSMERLVCLHLSPLASHAVATARFGCTDHSSSWNFALYFFWKCHVESGCVEHSCKTWGPISEF